MKRLTLTSRKGFAARSRLRVAFDPHHPHQVGGGGLTDAGDTGLYTFRQLVCSLSSVEKSGWIEEYGERSRGPAMGFDPHHLYQLNFCELERRQHCAGPNPAATASERHCSLPFFARHARAQIVSSVHRYANGTSRKPPVRRIARGVKTSEMPRHGRGPANFAWVNTPSSTCGLPPGLHDHHYSSAKCTTDITDLECAPALTRASPYVRSLFNQAAYGLAGYRFNLIPK